MIICLDRWQVHRSAAKQIANSRLQGIDFEWLPAYAPELNPVEGSLEQYEAWRLGQLHSRRCVPSETQRPLHAQEAQEQSANKNILLQNCTINDLRAHSPRPRSIVELADRTGRYPCAPQRFGNIFHPTNAHACQIHLHERLFHRRLTLVITLDNLGLERQQS